MPLRASVLLFALLAGLCPGTAPARERGAELIQRGVQALAARDFAAAYRALTLAYEKSPGPEALYQLGLLAAAEGRVLEAQDLMRRYLEETERDAVEDAPSRKEAERVLSAPRPAEAGEVGVIGERGALVYLDGRLVGALPLAQPLLVSAGAHRVAVSTKRRRLESPIDVQKNRTAEMRFNIQSGAVVTTLPPTLLLITSFRDVQEDAQERLIRVSERAVRGAHLALLPREVAEQVRGEMSCLITRSCRDELAARAQVEWILMARVEGGSVEKLSIHLIDSVTGDVADAAERSCPRCSPEEIGSALAALLGEVLTKGTARGRGILEVRSDPPADLSIGERRPGPTPYRGAALSGPVEVSLMQVGYRPERRSVVIRDGETTTVEVKLAMEPEEPPPAQPVPQKVAAPPPRRTVLRTIRDPRPVWRIGAGSAALGAGLVLAALGVSALAVDGACIQEAIPPALACRRIYDTLPAGAGLLSAGGALLITGALLIALPGPLRQVEVLVDRVPAGAGLRLAGRF